MAVTEKRLLSRDELCLAFRASRHTLVEWIAQGCPVAEPGGPRRQARFDLEAVINWHVERRLRQARATASGNLVDLASERARLARAQAARTLLEIGFKRKELLPASEVTEVFGRCIAQVRASVMALPASVAPRVVAAAVDGPAGVERVLREAVFALLGELAQYRPPGPA